MATPIENQIPASAQAVAVELTTGEHISSERAVKWFNTVSKDWVFQVELDGKQYLGKQVEDGRIHLQ
jgi:hypothetical protein